MVYEVTGNWLLCSNCSECGVTVGIFLVDIYASVRMHTES